MAIACLACALCALPLAACDVSSMQNLREFSHPYAGEYRCESLQFGGEEISTDKKLLLSLRENGEFSLCWKGEQTPLLKGEYSVSPDCDSISFRAEGLGRAFPIHKGKILIHFPLNDRLLVARFAFP